MIIILIMHPEYKILLVEDDKEVGQILQTTLDKERIFHITHSPTYHHAYKQLNFNYFDVVILDLQLPDGYGLDLIHQIKDDKTQIIVLTKEDNIETRLNSYKKGIAFFLSKPFYPQELLVLIKKVLHLLNKQDVIEKEPYRLFVKKRILNYKGESIHLTAIETIILEKLFRSEINTVNSDNLISSIRHKINKPYKSKHLAVAITRLRHKLKKQSIPLSLKSNYGNGYFIDLNEEKHLLKAHPSPQELE